MSEANQFKKPVSRPDGFENRNYNRRNRTNSDSLKETAQKPNFIRQAHESDELAQTNLERAEIDNLKTEMPESSPQKSIQPHSAVSEVKPALNLRLTERDFKIIEFILEMKFSSRHEIFEKFFSVTKALNQAKSNLYALERLALLEKAGFLKGLRSFSEITKYYVCTKKGYEALHMRIQTEKLPKPSPNIFERVFAHDKLVLLTRLEFEKAHPEGRWISDRKLRAGMAAMFNLPSAYIPDAIYELPTGEKVAFEFENALKGKSEYREKINYFVKLIDTKKDDPNMFTRVRYRCVRPDVFKILEEETSYYPGLFTVELWRPPVTESGGGSRPFPKPKVEDGVT